MGSLVPAALLRLRMQQAKEEADEAERRSHQVPAACPATVCAYAPLLCTALPMLHAVSTVRRSIQAA